ncbi:sulfatase-like hydrolase/transferase [Tuwongella immobilis]|uniref:Sulfatase N-terminal domain-containing protein n=1 Tax=Tuwongella immobilis TaxID=692036 RepID=A0A6C2YVZ8_9BACT|nr:sulfatase-like hydrolase/transferase [Tuwongella immobilis]VIP05561.1 choline sulfatase : Sulfatase OS=Planctomyces brasiliensis (strain ATCC 49424 / DSM 5305 / JCM 21570 / NBRC 103401 / IFAM 1448) GN=Plabr_1258 PE=4 SV=1: Sulfatase [Tuwongella immobilis]VTS08478.1 choline sulfatase : Sulfatase OS=Planctomyces brasiliensis (strain ATCC 49424 / DSM 5305 / JCM 21570 / NBRC 103401 / IFAM 1448) GN=Plabr_1258 PE=4 SV=1: Sulfatase [Tuwongella immobilis]
MIAIKPHTPPASRFRLAGWVVLLGLAWIGWTGTSRPAIAAPEPTKGMNPRPNVLLLFADDQRTDTISAWGNPAIQTPTLDRLVAKGMSFRNNYCFGSNSGAVCVPSRAMLLSGRTWLNVDSTLPSGVTLLPELLRQQGYATFMTGKWHNGQASCIRAFPNAQSVFLGGMNDHTKMPIVDIRNGMVTNKRIAARFSSETFADEAIRFISAQKGTQPFFCYVPFTAPHDPRNPPLDYREMYYRKRPSLPANFLPVHPFNNGMMKNLRDENLAGYPRDPKVIVEQLCEYYGLVSHLDAQIARILEALERSGQAKNTIIIYTADHGLAMGSHGLLGKQSLYEHSMKSPLIITGPGIPAGKSTDAMTYLFDLFPTICGLTETPIPDTVRQELGGDSLQPILSGEKSQIRDSIFLPFSALMRSVRDERWKWIVYPQINHSQLFDLKNDPNEITNLAEKPEHADTVKRLTTLMQQWQARVGDQQPLKSANPAPKTISFDGFLRKPDQWQPKWIVDKYFR